MRRAPSDPTLWKLLTEASNIDEAAPAWLALLCTSLGGVVRAVVVHAPPGGSQRGVAVWPDPSADISGLSGVVDAAMQNKRGVVRRSASAGSEQASAGTGGQSLVAYPLLVDDDAVGAVGLLVDVGAEESLRRIMSSLQWGVAWLRERVLHHQAREFRQEADRTRSALDLLAVGLEEMRFSSACRSLVTEMAVRMQCDRVSVGFSRKGFVAVEYISHSAQFGRRMNLVRMLGAAMDEAIDQKTVIRYPPEDDVLFSFRAHEKFVQAHESGTMLTIPMFLRDTFIGAFTFEREAKRPFSPGETTYLESLVSVCAPILEGKRQNDKGILVKVGEVAMTQVHRMLGPGYARRKLSLVASLAVLMFFVFAKTDYEVSAAAVLEGSIQRAIVAAHDGFIREAPARAGDIVRKGDLLVRLDDRELNLERLRWVSERQKRQLEYDRAISQHVRVESHIAQMQIDQANTRVRMIEERISRLHKRAPFDGIVVAGDLSQSIGAAVRRGQVLFEIAPLEAYRVILQVDESQIREIQPGSTGRLRIKSIPDEVFPIVVDRITPVAVAQEGKTFFRVEAKLEAVDSRLRPGMSGVGRVEVEERGLAWIWSRTFLEWLRIQVWGWFG